MKEWETQLKELLEQQEQVLPFHFFFRDDDVDCDEESLQKLLQFFARREKPLNLGVIPALLTAEAIELLAEYQVLHPKLFSLNQHGWQHLNHERQGRKCEFGVSRSLAEQLDDIARGQARLNEAFGTHWFPAFIPPWNRCTLETCQALDQLGFRVLSAKRSRTFVTGYGFREISVTLDLFSWKGGACLRPVEELTADLIAQIRQARFDQLPVGVMLHHKVMGDDAYVFLASLLDALAQYEFVHCHTFESLIEIAGSS